MKENVIKKGDAIADPAKNAATAAGGTAALSPFVNYSTKKTARQIFDEITVGRANAVKIGRRDTSDCEQRALRALVQRARKQGVPIINEQDGRGYYIADVEDPVELQALHEQIESLRNRALDMLETAAALEKSAAILPIVMWQANRCNDIVAAFEKIERGAR